VSLAEGKDPNRNSIVLYGGMRCRCKTLGSLNQDEEHIVVERRGAPRPFSKRKKNGKECFVYNE
jgi:hypothetical protein